VQKQEKRGRVRPRTSQKLFFQVVQVVSNFKTHGQKIEMHPIPLFIISLHDFLL
jgi:hypothetical protein